MYVYFAILIFPLFLHRYFKKMEDKGGSEEKADAYYWWHKKLADYFEHIADIDRYVEVGFVFIWR